MKKRVTLFFEGQKKNGFLKKVGENKLPVFSWYLSSSFLLILFVMLSFSCSSTSFSDIFASSYGLSTEELAAEYYDIANAYYDLKKYDKAIEYYEKAQSFITEENLTITYNLARIYALKNNWGQAELYYERIFQQDQNNTSVGMPYAYVLAKQGKAMEASALYRGFYERNPADAKLLANYTLVLLEMGEDYEANSLFEELKLLAPDSDEVKKVEEAFKKKAEADQPEESEESDSTEESDIPEEA